MAEETVQKLSLQTPSNNVPPYSRSSPVRRGRFADQSARIVFMLCAILIVAIIFGVFIFVGINGFRVFTQDPHASNFFSSLNWDPEGTGGETSFGALGLLLGSVVTTLLAVVIATPLAWVMALFMTEVTPRWLENILRPLLEIFTGMPSVVIGFLALAVVVPYFRQAFGKLTPLPPTAGYGWAAATVVLIVMILPTIISVSIDALRAVPQSVREASLALGSTRWQMMRNAVLPAALSGLATAVVLGMARAIGEALAVSMVLGVNSVDFAALFKDGIGMLFEPNVNVTNAIVLNFQEAFGAARSAYFMLGFVLLVVSFLFICISRFLASRSVYK
ncbi:MAG: phosphate ABC transporter permease subunit PstC [Ktedonobacteraceae bacterium]|nr:phosphate ABC transporter permease subunit PstC [Ktedonobacteraceae bacterium]